MFTNIETNNFFNTFRNSNHLTSNRTKKNGLKHFEFTLSMSFVFIILEFIHRVLSLSRGKPSNSIQEHFFIPFQVNSLIIWFFCWVCYRERIKKKNYYSIAEIHRIKLFFFNKEKNDENGERKKNYNTVHVPHWHSNVPTHFMLIILIKC